MCWRERKLVRHLCGCLVLIATGTAACRTTPTTSAVPKTSPAARAAPACPAPELGHIDWILVDDSSGFTIALPLGYQERTSGGAFRHWQLAADFQQSMSFGIIRGELGIAGYRRVYQAEVMLDYSECSDTVGELQISIQSWRSPNGVFRNYRRFDRYDVFAIWQVRPGVYGYLAGGTQSRQTQEIMLGAIRLRR
ncbi:MAG: hypothetical protein ACREOG_09090 [Gemmatimonadaceae bacterium]